MNSKQFWKHSLISTNHLNKQKQPFTDVLQNRYSEKFRNNHRKTSVLESLFNRVRDLSGCSFIKKKLQHRCFLVNIANFLRTAFLIEHFW